MPGDTTRLHKINLTAVKSNYLITRINCFLSLSWKCWLTTIGAYHTLHDATAILHKLWQPYRRTGVGRIVALVNHSSMWWRTGGLPGNHNQSATSQTCWAASWTFLNNVFRAIIPVQTFRRAVPKFTNSRRNYVTPKATLCNMSLLPQGNV